MLARGCVVGDVCLQETSRKAQSNKPKQHRGTSLLCVWRVSVFVLIFNVDGWVTGFHVLMTAKQLTILQIVIVRIQVECDGRTAVVHIISSPLGLDDRVYTTELNSGLIPITKFKLIAELIGEFTYITTLHAALRKLRPTRDQCHHGS